eukprot:1328913-Pyramimonas_sp.AAC.1
MADRAMYDINVDPELAYAILEQNADVTATFRFGPVESESLPWSSCIKTGSLEGPDIWNIVTIACLGK